jgi:hypothetical protein
MNLTIQEQGIFGAGTGNFLTLTGNQRSIDQAQKLSPVRTRFF